jgi:tetratricopeptide (TPR) repeat protein
VPRPNLAAAWFLGGFVQIMQGEPDSAIERLAYAMRLSPLDSEMYRMQGGTALAHLFAGRYDEAAPWAEKALRDLPSFLIMLCVMAASHALAGRMDEARSAMGDLRRFDPSLRIFGLKDWLHSIGRNTWQSCPKVCEEPVCQIERLWFVLPTRVVWVVQKTRYAIGRSINPNRKRKSVDPLSIENEKAARLISRKAFISSSPPVPL